MQRAEVEDTSLMRRGLWLAPFGELADARLLAELGRRAERARWDGLFLWDHIEYGSAATPIADRWIALAAIANVTHSIVLGTLVTSLPRRHVHKLARETATLDRLSGGRLVLGVGLGSGSIAQLGLDGAPTGVKDRARALDAGLELLTNCWNGDLQPLPVQRPRVPVWVGSEWPHRQPLRRAAQWDGWFPVGVGSPDQLAEGITEIRRNRPGPDRGRPYEVIASGSPGDDFTAWRQAGATWWLTGFGPSPQAGQVRSEVDAGP
jgi:alkanesulfonate monooxygenase SsuD/methylene tetrahydromethanopterin reductase-like flavin-dependent oxidoreductase (luciferase family)